MRERAQSRRTPGCGPKQSEEEDAINSSQEAAGEADFEGQGDISVVYFWTC